MARVAKGNKIDLDLDLDFAHLCPSAAWCRRRWLVRPTTRKLQKLHVFPDVLQDLEHAAVTNLTMHLLLSCVLVGEGEAHTSAHKQHTRSSLDLFDSQRPGRKVETPGP